LETEAHVAAPPTAAILGPAVPPESLRDWISPQDAVECLYRAQAGAAAGAMSEILDVLRQAALFDGLSPQELEAIAGLCRPRSFASGEIITTQGEQGDELYIVGQGFVEVTLVNPEGGEPRSVVQLGPGQLVGEMALLDRGPRSATVRALTDGALVQTVQRGAFLELCQSQPHLGYIVMRNMAVDLAFKLRHRMLTGR